MRLWVREALWLFADENRRAPTWAEAVEIVANMAMCDRTGAERRILKALKRDEATAQLDDAMEWRLGLGPASAKDPDWFRKFLAEESRA